MKNYSVFFITLILLISCTKEQTNTEPEFYNGYATAKINGEDINLKPRMAYSYGKDNHFNLSLVYLINDQILRKVLRFSPIKKGFQLQKLHIFDISDKDSLQSSFSTLLYDGDVMGNYYWLNETDTIEDYLMLTKIDESTGEVEGIFQASFYVDTNDIVDPNSPDTIVITDGYFETVIFE